jgi:DNA-binding HxlR family transcriptional regulator
MMSNQTKFNEFIESVQGINPKTLSTRLKEMEKNSLIHRKIYHETPIRIEYCLTEKGKALNMYLTIWLLFSTQYCPDAIFKDGKPRTLQQVIKH